MPHSRDERISVEYDAFSSVEIVLGFFKIKDLLTYIQMSDTHIKCQVINKFKLIPSRFNHTIKVYQRFIKDLS